MNITPPSLDIISQTLEHKGLRPSFQRIKVLEYFYKNEGHPNADEIFHDLSREIPSLSKATVYNTLHALEQAGILHVLNIDDEELRYDIMLEPHGHFKCNNCGKIQNFKIEISNISIKELEQFQILEKNVIFKGLCPSCLSNQKILKEKNGK